MQALYDDYVGGEFLTNEMEPTLEVFNPADRQSLAYGGEYCDRPGYDGAGSRQFHVLGPGAHCANRVIG